MRQLIAALLISSITLPLHAELTPARSGQPAQTKPATAVAKNVAKAPDERTFLQRLFGVRPKPTPTPTPAPEMKRRLKSRVKREPAEIPTETAPKVAKTGKGSSKRGTPTNTGVTAEDDMTKFKTAKAHALEDAHLRDLKIKADSELNESEAHKALLNYNRALFQKIREIDPTVSDYAGKVEQSMTRRIGAEKGKE